MHRISSRPVLLRALLCALVLLLALAPITGAAAATPDVDENAATAAASATEVPAATGSAAVGDGGDVATTAETTSAASEPAEVTATEQDATPVEASVTQEGGANQDGPYTPDPTASPTPSGNGNNNNNSNKPCAGCVGNADDKNPPGQMPGPDTDGDVGYECDGNQGVGKGNPAHTQCPPPDPQINIDKSGPATSSVGATITYTMVVTNPGNRPMSNVTVSDPDCDTAPVRTGGDANSDSVLQTTETWTYTCPRVVQQGDPSPLPNVATVRGTSPEGVTKTDQDDHSVILSTVQPSPPRIDIDKTGPATSTVGATITYTMVVTNPVANVPLSNVVVSDPDCDANTLSGPTRSGGNGDAILEFGETWTYTCTRLVLAGDAGKTLPNTATVVGTSHTTGGGTVTDLDNHSVTIPPAAGANVTITKDPDLQTVVSGGTATWTITIRNTGNVPLTNVRVTDPQAPDCERLAIGTLGVGVEQSWSCSRAGVTAPFTNVATVHTNELPDREDSAAVNIVPQQTSPSVLLRKTAVTPTCPTAGDTVTYRFEIVNNGSQTLNSVTLNDPLLGGVVTVPDTTLTAGEVTNATGSYTLTQADIDAGQLQNTATVTSLAPSGAPVSNTGQAVVMLQDCPGEILLEKEGPATAQVGEQITYTFTVTNAGDVTLTNVRITDARLRISGLLVNPSTLEPGQSGTATATYTVTRADARRGHILNTAFVRARTPDDTELEDDDDHRTTVPPVRPGPEPGIRVVKSGPAIANAGETVTYSFTVTNTGDVTLRNVSITDPLLGLSRLRVRPSTLAPDEQGTATATYVITQADADAGSVYNTAVARGRPPTGPPVTDDDDHTIEVPLVPPVCPSPPCGPPAPPPELPATGLGTTGFALTALLSLALGGVLLGIAGSGNLQAAVANATVNADSPMLAMLRRWNLAPKPGGSQARRRRRRH